MVKPDPSVSNQVTLVVVSYPKATFVGYSAPPSAHNGEAVQVSVTLKNDGGSAGTLWAQLAYKIDSLPVTKVAPASFAVLEQKTLTIALNMPGADTAFTLTQGHNVDSTAVQDGTATYFTILLAVATTLTLTLPITTVTPGAAVSFSGRLTVTDTLAGIGSKGVDLKYLVGTTWTLVKSVTTILDGTYSSTFTAPASPASYVYRTEFAGSGALSASVSSRMLMTVGDAVAAIKRIAGPILVGAISLFLSLR